MPSNTLVRKKILPVGSVERIGSSTVPDGYLACDGSILNIEDYPELFNIIGYSCGYGNNDGLTFHLPDLRGRFLRGLDDGAGRDVDASNRIEMNTGGNVGDAIGSVQGDTIPNLTGTTRYNIDLTASSGAFYHNTSGRDADGNASTTANRANFDADRVVPTGSKNRPANIYLNYVIKVI